MVVELKINSKVNNMLKSAKEIERPEERMPSASYSNTEFLKGVNEEIRPQFEGTADLQTFLKTDGRLTIEDMRLIVEQAMVLLEMFYVHMPLKRAMHAIDPLQRLRLLKHRIEQLPEGQEVSEIRFHREMTRIFTSLRDLHTNYLLPAPFNDKTAFLPFLIEEYFEDRQRKYIISKVFTGFSHPAFKPGVEVLYWNGIPIEKAIELNADRQAGSNPEAQHARGLDSMTIRPLFISLPPDEEWVVIGYRSLNGEELELKQDWLISSPERGIGAVDPNSTSREATALGIDIKTSAIQEVKKLLFAPDVVVDEQRILRGESLSAAPSLSLETSMPGVFRARTVETPDGTFGYIRVYTFNVNDDDQFVTEFIRLADSLPQNGLIIDMRGNGGGLIFASERLLQVLTPRHIKPEPVQFINTLLTYELCRRYSHGPINLSPWAESIRQAVETGAAFSQAFPITPEEACNSIGQKYLGPVILITDALCYSATDIFAGGFQDHKIGPILGTNMNTGAGGANVWTQKLLMDLMSDLFKPLPKGAGMRVSIRRTLRVLEHEGMPVEDLGVVPDYKHDMTKDDVLKDNADLINHAASILAKKPVYKILTSINRTDGKISVNASTENISRLDVYLEDRPQRSMDVIDNSAEFILELPETGASFIELRGFKNNNLVATRRIWI
jgi:C-terminal processing protease CtpA/Prc